MGEGRVSNRRGGDRELDKNLSVASDNNEEVQGVPKKLALGKYLEIATHGFKMCIFYVKRDKLGPNPSRLLIVHP